MAKEENGFGLAVLTTSAMTFAVTGFTLPEFDGGDLPDTTTNSNVTYRSVGINKFIKIGPASITGAFDAVNFALAPTTINTKDTLTVTLQSGAIIEMGVVMQKYTVDEATTDSDMTTATFDFNIDTGINGDTGITITQAP